jgi:type VI secretion system secreted protein VgrG
MSAELTETITTALAQFSTASRLYALTVGDGSADLGSGGLLVEAFAADDAVQGIGGRDVIVVSTDAHIALAPLLGQPASLEVSLADGSRTSFSGDITEVAMLGSEGGLQPVAVRRHGCARAHSAQEQPCRQRAQSWPPDPQRG